MQRSITFARIVMAGMAVLMLAAVVLAHGGGLDSQGGHHDRKHGGYHFHQGPLAGQTFPSKDAATAALRAYYEQQGEPKQPEPREPGKKQESDSKAVALTTDQRLDVLVRLLESKGILPQDEFQKEVDKETERQRRSP